MKFLHTRKMPVTKMLRNSDMKLCRRNKDSDKDNDTYIFLIFSTSLSETSANLPECSSSLKKYRCENLVARRESHW